MDEDKWYLSGPLTIGEGAAETQPSLPPLGTLQVNGGIFSARASDGTNAGHINWYNLTNKKTWHLTMRSGDGDKLQLFHHDGSNWIWPPPLNISPDGNVGIGTNNPQAKLHVAEGKIKWGNNSVLTGDQGGSIELGGDSVTPGIGTPYIDFHQSGLTQDYNARIINDANGRLSFISSVVHVPGQLGIGANPDHKLTILGAASDGSVQQNIYNPNNGNGQVAGLRFHTASGWNVMLRTNQDNAWLELTDGNGFWRHRWINEDYYALGKVDIKGNLKVGGDLEIGGRLKSGKWKISRVVNARGPLPIQRTFTSAGGALLVLASGSGWSAIGGKEIGMRVVIDGWTDFDGGSVVYTNESSSHKNFVAEAFPSKNSSGNHTLELVKATPDTLTDINDFFRVLVIEFPF